MASCRRAHRLGSLALAAIACAVGAPTASAGIWQKVEAPNTSEVITAIDFQGGDRFWIAMSGKIFKRAGSGWEKQLDKPGVVFNDLELNSTGTVGIAVGEENELWRYSGGSWTKLPTLQSPYPSDGGCLTPGGAAQPAGNMPPGTNLTNVRWVRDDSAVFVTVNRSGRVFRSIDGVAWTDINRLPDGSCRISDTIRDVFVLPANHDYMLFAGGALWLSTNGLTSTAAYRGSVWGSDRLLVDESNPQRIYAGPQHPTFGFSEDGGATFRGPAVKTGASPGLYDFDVRGGTALGAGNAGHILTSIDPKESYAQPADGALLTNDWRAVDLANTSQGAVGGLNGGLVVSSQLNTIPDIVAPAGTIQAPDSAIAGTTVTFTANATDNAGGSGIDANGYAWKNGDTAIGGGQSIAVNFPTTGYFTIQATFADSAGNTATARKSISINSPTPLPVPFDGDDPTGSISGPELAVAGQAATFTANASDSGSGIDSSGFRWTRDGISAGTGRTVSITFPKSGTDDLEVSFRDLAANRATARVAVAVAPKPADRPKPVPVDTPKPKVKRQGGRYVIPLKGGFKLPRSVAPKLGCKGDILFTLKKSKRLLSARATKLNEKCRYSKSFSVAKSKVGAVKTLGLTVRFSGNGWLAPGKTTYSVKVPR